jgi:hypothetical protein
VERVTLERVDGKHQCIGIDVPRGWRWGRPRHHTIRRWRNRERSTASLLNTDLACASTQKKKKRLRGLYSQRRRPRTQHKQKQYLSREHQCFLSASRLGDAETKAAQPAWCCVELAKTAASPQPRGPTTKALPPKSNEAARHSSSLRSRIHQVHISCISSSPSVTQAYHNRDRDIPAFYGCCGGKTR